MEIKFPIQNIFNRNKFKKNQFLISEVSFSEYLHIYENMQFIATSHIQSPGYYPNQNQYHYFKICSNNNNIGIVSLYEKNFCFNLIKIMRMNDGPLISKNYANKKYIILKEVLKYIKENFTRIISFAPPFIYKYDYTFRSFNIIKLKSCPSKTYIVDLLNSEKILIKNLRSNWRNGLKKSLKFSTVDEIRDLKKIKKILLDYNDYAKKLSFRPISFERCLFWYKNNQRLNELLTLKIFEASSINEKEKKLGSIGVLFFKNKALYLFGFTNSLGRKYQANSLLLWHAITESKEIGLKEFDLGGFNSKTNNGIKNFKKGINGKLLETLGEYIYIGIF